MARIQVLLLPESRFAIVFDEMREIFDCITQDQAMVLKSEMGAAAVLVFTDRVDVA